MPEPERASLMLAISKLPPPRYTADEIAHRLGITMAQRGSFITRKHKKTGEERPCQLSTIGAIDADPAERELLRKKRRALRAIQVRREKLSNIPLAAMQQRPGRGSAICVALIDRDWVSIDEIANTLGRWKAFEGLSAASLRRVIRNECDLLKKASPPQIEDDERPSRYGKIRLVRLLRTQVFV
jgi:hypothetical protein